MSLFLLVAFLVMSVVGVPLAVALGLASVLTLVLFTHMPLDLLSQTMFSSMNSFLLVAVPLFILVGAVMEQGRVAERIFDFAEALVGWLPGGLGHVNVASSVIFSGVSGSSVADIASVGAIEIKAMERHGFPKGYAVGMTLCTATLSSIIPPSILVVIAGSIANVSIGALLVAGLVPGLFIAFAFMVFNHFYSVHYGYNPPSPFVLRNVFVTGLRAILPMMTPVILMAGIASGIFTPTEAAAVAVVYVLALGLVVYRTIPLSAVPGILISTARISGTILFIAATSQVAAWIFTYEDLPSKVAVLLDAISFGPVSGLLIIFVFLLLIGIFMEAIPAMFILIPVLMPSALSLGIDPMHFLIVTVMTLTLGLVTPPVGVCLFAAAQVANMRVEDVIRGSLAPMTVLTVAILLLVLFPILTVGPIRWLGLYG
ncbi:TRAP transporter large permease [Aureimonas ureilytica]|uniref:TRAP transporter large permease n=1 Tax=Aureimonas ureilytica TaxID=401562 RepID=UPI000476B818|nr:TRAP transporter large permease [Aureimonas ureilytica]